jgi:glutathione synthase/RimK-type ligase-like ATP-grasp enzyme
MQQLARSHAPGSLRPLFAASPYFTSTPALVGQAAWMQAMFDGDDLSQAAAALIKRANNNPMDADALLDLACTLILRGDQQTGLALQAEALQIKRFYQLQFAARAPALRLLVLKAAGNFMANTPIEFLLQHPRISVDVLYVGSGLPTPIAAPTHDAIFVAVSEAEHNIDTLLMIEQLLQTWHNPVINQPALIPGIGRDKVWQCLAAVPGLHMPVNFRRSRAPLQRHQDLDYPMIIRPLDSHAGIGLEKLESAADLQRYLQNQPAEVFYLAPFIDYRSTDGQFRKYRIVFIDGAPFLCHMAISSHWMVHYLNAGMNQDANKRAEEARVMDSFKTNFCARHRDAFAGLAEQIGLDYFGIDCAETLDGELLIFEVANAMVVHAMDPVDMFPYKTRNMQAVFDAFQNLLFDRARIAQQWLAKTA